MIPESVRFSGIKVNMAIFLMAFMGSSIFYHMLAMLMDMFMLMFISNYYTITNYAMMLICYKTWYDALNSSFGIKGDITEFRKQFVIKISSSCLYHV